MAEKILSVSNSSFSIEPCDKSFDLFNDRRFTKLTTNEHLKSQLMLATQQFPTLMAAESIANMYIVKFPKGIPEALTPLKQGRYMSMVQGEGGRLVGTASLYSASVAATLLNVFRIWPVFSFRIKHKNGKDLSFNR